MVSKKNIQEKIRKMEEKKEHHAIRKLTMGAASVLIGLSLMNATGRSVKASIGDNKEEVVVQTEEKVEHETNDAETTTVDTPSESTSTETTVEQEQTVTTSQENNTNVVTDTSAEESTTTPATKAETVQTEDVIKQETTQVPSTEKVEQTTTPPNTATVSANKTETTDTERTKKPTYNDALDKVDGINSSVNKDLEDAATEAGKVEGVTIDKKDPIDIIIGVNDIDKNKELLEKYTQEQIAEIKKELAEHQAKLDKYKDDLKKYNEARDAYIKRLKKLGLWKEGEHIDPDSLSQKLELGKEENTQIKVEALKPGVTQGSGSMLNGLLDNFWEIHPDRIDGDFLKVTYTQLENSYYNDELLSKIEVIFSDWEKSDHPQQNGRKPGIYFSKNPTDGFFYVKANGVTVELKFYDSKGKLVTLGENTAYITVGSLNSQGSGSDYVEKAEIINGNGHWGSGVALPESSVTIHPGNNGDILFSDINNDIFYNKNISEAKKQELIAKYGEEFVNKYLGWDDSSDRSKEIFGAGLFKVHGNGIKIRFSNQLGSAWATFSTTIPKITFEAEKPEAPTTTISYQPKRLVLKKNSSVHIHYVDVHDEAMKGTTNFKPEHGQELTEWKQSHTHLAVDDVYSNELWDYLAANYILATDTVDPGTLGGVIKDGEQHFYVYLKRKTETISRDKVVNQIIHYIYEDGSQAAPSHVSVKLTFTQTGTKDLVTGKETWDGEWTKTQTFVTIVSPIIEGYHTDKPEVGPYEITVNNDNFNDNLDKVDTVVYVKNIDQPTQPSTPTQPTDPQPTTPDQPTNPSTPDQPTDPQPTEPTMPNQPTAPEPETPEDNSINEMPKPETDPSTPDKSENSHETVTPKKENNGQVHEATIAPKKQEVSFTQLATKASETSSSTQEEKYKKQEQAQTNALPETGANETNKAGIFGVLLAAIGSLFGLAVSKKRKKN